MPEAIAGDESGQSGKPSYAYTVKAKIATVEDFYASEMPKIGWSQVASGSGTTGNVLAMYSKGDKALTIAIIKADEAGLVLVILAPT